MKLRDLNGRFANHKWYAVRIIFYLVSVLAFLYVITSLLVKYNEWSHLHKWQKPYEFSFKTRSIVADREPLQVLSPFAKEIVEEQTLEGLTDHETYICEKFPITECKIALAVSKAENSKRDPEAWNYNSNGTLDIGLFQVNQVNWKTCQMTMKDLLDPYKNVDCAYQIWDRTDGVEGNNKGSFSPWVQFNNGVFISNL